MPVAIQEPSPLPSIDFERVKAALYAWPFSPLRDCLQAEGIAPEPVEYLMKLDPSIESLVQFWLFDRQEPEDDGIAVS